MRQITHNKIQSNEHRKNNTRSFHSRNPYTRNGTLPDQSSNIMEKSPMEELVGFQSARIIALERELEWANIRIKTQKNKIMNYKLSRQIRQDNKQAEVIFNWIMNIKLELEDGRKFNADTVSDAGVELLESGLDSDVFHSVVGSIDQNELALNYNAECYQMDKEIFEDQMRQEQE